MFAGMFPGRGNIQHPRGLSPQREAVNSFAAAAEQFLEDADLETSTQMATEEWKSILMAFNLFKDSLGDDFQPMSPELHPPRDSPFGPVWTYRTLPIAGIWMNFYMGLVILHRAHPTMPPFAMVAAHMCARETQPFANEIGKIVAGVSDGWGAEPKVSTSVSAAYIECCFPLFVGAVQVSLFVPPIDIPKRKKNKTLSANSGIAHSSRISYRGIGPFAASTTSLA